MEVQDLEVLQVRKARVEFTVKEVTAELQISERGDL